MNIHESPSCPQRIAVCLAVSIKSLSLVWMKVREEEALSLRKESTQIMELLSAYTDRFTVYEYVLNRLEYRFSGASLEAGYSDEDMTQEILQKLSSETDQTVRQSMLVSIIEQLPMRMTRKRFFQVLAEGMDAYKGSDKEAVDGQLFMLRTAAMLEEPAEFKDRAFRHFMKLWRPLRQAPLSAVSEAEWNELHDMLAERYGGAKQPDGSYASFAGAYQ